jgi:hypothetical protein
MDREQKKKKRYARNLYQAARYQGERLTPRQEKHVCGCDKYGPRYNRFLGKTQMPNERGPVTEETLPDLSKPVKYEDGYAPFQTFDKRFDDVLEEYNVAGKELDETTEEYDPVEILDDLYEELDDNFGVDQGFDDGKHMAALMSPETSLRLKQWAINYVIKSRADEEVKKVIVEEMHEQVEDVGDLLAYISKRLGDK